jgi:succinyl-CoA synthetase beta subunit
VLLVNAYFQLQRTDTVAEGVALALDHLPPERKRFKPVIRLRGVGQERARAILAGYGCVFTLDFDDACRQAVALARAGRRLRPSGGVRRPAGGPGAGGPVKAAPASDGD